MGEPGASAVLGSGFGLRFRRATDPDFLSVFGDAKIAMPITFAGFENTPRRCDAFHLVPLDFGDCLEDFEGDLRHDGVAERMETVCPIGYPIRLSTNEGCG